MYPYQLLIVAEGLRLITHHKTYGEAIAMKLELEAKGGEQFNITVNVCQTATAIDW